MLSSVSSQPADVQPHLPPGLLCPPQRSQTQTPRALLLVLAASRAGLSVPNSRSLPLSQLPSFSAVDCWSLPLCSLLLNSSHSWKRSHQCKIGLDENWFIMHVALPAGSRLSSQLWPDVCWRSLGCSFRRCFGRLAVVPVGWLSQTETGVVFVTVGLFTPHQCTQGCSLSSALLCGALQGEDAPLAHLELCWH